MSVVMMAVGFYAIQWNRAAYLGKSPEQIVAMGRSRWYGAYTKKHGESTAAMCEAETTYGDALKNVNDRAMRRLPTARQEFLRSARYHCREIAKKGHEVGYAITGGGTMWHPIFAGIHPNVEELISEGILNKPMPAVKLKSIESRIEEMDTISKKAMPEMREESISEFKKAFNEFRYQESVSRKFIESAPEHDRTRLRMFVHKQFDIAIAREMIGDGAQS